MVIHFLFDAWIGMRNRTGCWRTSAKVSRVKVYFEWMSASQIVAVNDIQLLFFRGLFQSNAFADNSIGFWIERSIDKMIGRAARIHFLDSENFADVPA